MSSSPDWFIEENYAALKTVLKWEIQHLLQRLADVGEEALLLTVCVKDGDTTEMGSPRGQGFLSVSELQNVKSQFKSYCQSFSEIYKQMEIYRDLSSGELSLGPKALVDIEHRRKRRKKTYLQQAKILCSEERNIKQELSSNSDDNSVGNIVSGDQEEFQSTANTDTDIKLSLPMLSMRSRRKRTPKKVVTNTDIVEDDNNENGIPEKSYQAKVEYLDDQSEDVECAQFYVKNSQSMEQINECQSEGLKATSHSEDFSINELPYKQVNCNLEIDNDLFKKKSTPYQRSLHEEQEENNEFSILLKNTKNAMSKKSGKSLQKSSRINSSVNSETDNNSLIDIEKSMPVFPNIENLNQSWSGHEVSMDVFNNDENDEDYVPVKALRKDRHSNKEVMKVDTDLNSSLLQNDSRTSLDRLSTTAEKGSKLDKQGLENVTPLTPSRKKGFKPVPPDENPAETALLDSSKLGVGRYKCPMCGQTTRDRHDLKRHLRTHTKEKPYKCSLCGKKFTRKWDLENHFTRHNKSERDDANSKIGKQFNKMVEASNSEVLTYEKLVSKLLREKNISVEGSDDINAQQAENEWIVLGEMKPSGNSSTAAESKTPLSTDIKQPTQGKHLLNKKVPDRLLSAKKQDDKSEENSSNDGATADVDNVSTEEELKNGNVLDEKTSLNGIMPFDDVLDNSLVPFMNDMSSTVSMETGNDVKIT